jgi:hypothetical protein
VRKVDVACDLLVRAGRQLGTLRPCRPFGGSWVLSRLAYLAVCRSVQLLVLLARGDAALIGTGIVLAGIALVQRRTPAPAPTPEASTRELGGRQRPGQAAPPGPPG